jgi:hypothetical protein
MGFHCKEWGELCNFVFCRCWAFHFQCLHTIVLSLCKITLLPWSFWTFDSCAFALLPTKLSFFLVYVCSFRVVSFLAYVCNSRISKVLLMLVTPKLPVSCLCMQLQSFQSLAYACSSKASSFLFINPRVELMKLPLMWVYVNLFIVCQI